MPALDSVARLSAVLFLAYAAVGATAPLISLYLEDLGASYSLISVILTTHAVTGLAFNYVWGRLSDRLGRRRPIVVAGLLGMAGSFGLFALAPTYQIAWVIRILSAIAMTAYTVASLALMGDLLATQAGRGRRMGSYRGFGSLSFALGAFGAKPVVDAFGLRPIFWVGALCFLAAGLVAWTVEEASPSTVEDEQASERTGRPLAAAFLLGVFLWTAAFWAAYSMWPNYLTHLGYPQSTASWLWGVAAISEVPFMTAVGALADVWGRAPMLALGGVGLGLVLLGYLSLHRWLWALAGVQMFRGFAYSAFTATSMIYAAESGTSRTRAGTVGTYNVAMALGQILGLSLGGQVVQFMGFASLFLMSTAIFLASGVIFLTLRRSEATQAASLG